MRAHTQHAPLPILHWPADDVTLQGAGTLVIRSAAPQLHSSPHTAMESATAHTQHAPLPSEQLPVDDCTEHGPYSLTTSVAAPQLHSSPHTATVRVCVTWRRVPGGVFPSSLTRVTWANAGMVSSSTSQMSAHCCLRCFPRMTPSSCAVPIATPEHKRGVWMLLRGCTNKQEKILCIGRWSNAPT
jgi:hypothetical protein